MGALEALGFFLHLENTVLSNKTLEFTARAARGRLCARIRCSSPLGAAACARKRCSGCLGTADCARKRGSSSLGTARRDRSAACALEFAAPARLAPSKWARKHRSGSQNAVENVVRATSEPPIALENSAHARAEPPAAKLK